MRALRYYIDDAKAEEFAKENNIIVRPKIPNIKNPDGIYSDVGIDIFAAYETTVAPWSYKVIKTFVGFLYEPGTWAEIRPRGGDIFLIGSGILDTGYVGTTSVRIVNPYSEPIHFDIGSSLGQIIIGVRAYVEGIDLKIVSADFAKSLKTDRGESGRINDKFNL